MLLPYPSLRQGLVGAWCPSLWTASRMIEDRSGLRNHGAIVTPAYDANLPSSTVAANVMSAAIPAGTIGTSATWSVWLRIFGASGSGCFQVTQNPSFEIYQFSDGRSYFSTFLANAANTRMNPLSSLAAIRTPTQLNHIAITTDTVSVSVYANGIPWTSTTAQSFVMRPSILIGGSQRTSDSSPTPLQGSWDDARLYNRALSLSEIRLLASRRGIGLSPSAPLHDDDSDLQNYPIADPPNRVHANVDGVWVPSQVRANASGTWGNGETLVNEGGVWPARQYHPESLFWRSRVEAGGGTVSDTTLDAVSTFCAAIDAAGIRDRFARLNLFCGTGLSACLTPLYLSLSYQGGELGNATDRNFNFVAGDYVETGANGGLKGNGTSKCLRTGVLGTAVVLGNCHLSSYVAEATTVFGFPTIIGSWNTNGNTLQHSAAASGSQAYYTENGVNMNFAVSNPTGLMVGTSTSLSDRRNYLNGSQSGSTNTTALTSSQLSQDYAVFAIHRNLNAPSNFSSARLSAYSIGLGMTASQVAAFNTALATFRTALGRS